MKNLLSWLKNPKRTYADGLNLLKSFNHKDFSFYSRAMNPEPQSFEFRMLYSLIKNIARKESQNPAKAEKAEISVKTLSINNQPENKAGVTIVSNPIVDFKELPKDLQSLFLDNKSLTKEIAQEHVIIKSAKSDNERKELLESIQLKESTRTANWKTIDAWWSEKQNQIIESPEEASTKKQIQEDTLKQIKRINGLKINISRATKELKDLSGKKADTRKTKIENWKKELHELEQQQ